MRKLLRAIARLPKSSRLRKFGSHPVKPTGCNPRALNLRRRGILVVQALGVLLWCAGISTPFAAAQDRFDPAALARTIAPLIEEQTVAVARIDVTRIALDPLFEKAGSLFPDLKVELPLAKLAAATWREAFSRAGGRDVYAVITLAPMKRFEPVSAFLVVPLRPGADEKSLQATFQIARLTAERVGDVLVAADTRETLEWIRKIKPDPRPELAAAFEAAGDATVQLLLLPPKYAQRVIEETMPMLPEVIGGGPTSVFTRGGSWLAVGLDGPPRMSVRVVIQSQDAQAAEALRAKWLDLLRQTGKHPEMPRFIPAFDQVAKLLTPQVERDRLVLVLNEENKGIPTLVTTILQPAIRHALGSAAGAQSANQLKQIGMAILTHHDARKRLPAAASYGPDGKPLLSWRVHILPYFEHNELYKQFRLNEPWDSPHNKTLIAKMPRSLSLAGLEAQGAGADQLRRGRGPEDRFRWPRGHDDRRHQGRHGVHDPYSRGLGPACRGLDQAGGPALRSQGPCQRARGAVRRRVQRGGLRRLGPFHPAAATGRDAALFV